MNQATEFDKLVPAVHELLSKVSKLHLVEYPFRDQKGDSNVFEDNNSFGYLPLKAKDLYLCTKLPSVDHEIAHTVDMPVARCTTPDWGIKNSIDIGGWSNNYFFAALTREVRVRAIQLHLITQEHWKYKNIFTSRILENPAWGHQANMRLPFGRFKKHNQLVDWIHTIHMQTYKRWSIDRIVHEWAERVKIINDWIETA